MEKNIWRELAKKGPIAALAPMDGYTDSAYRQIVKEVAPNTVVFSEFFSADGLTHSKRLQETALKHSNIEHPLIIQIFGKDPAKFAEAAKIIQDYGVDGIDINMGCPARKVVRSGHGSGLMIQRETAFKIVEAIVKVVDIPVSVKTRLGWENDEPLVDFCKGLENAGASLITVHGRTYKQAYKGDADFTGIYRLKQALRIPVIGNGDIMSYDEGMQKIISPNEGDKPLDGFMIGRASFGNPWCLLPGKYVPTLSEVLDTMTHHGELLWDCKERKGMMEARKHLVQYLRNFPGVKTYRSQLVHVESVEDIMQVIHQIKAENTEFLNTKIDSF